jgi:eukaryotic-like serine/threonine-protein kinase
MAESANGQPTDDYQPTVPERPAASSASPKQPTQIDHYRIEKLLGKGGFGCVYLAYDVKLQRPVAIKVPHPELVSRPEDAELYLAEARAAAKLDHPHITPILYVGSTAEYPFFSVSKFIDGGTLAAKIKHDRPPYPEAAELVATVAEALHYAHSKGVFHRDIKPSNILLDLEGNPYVADFGLALREEDVGKGPRHVGTPTHMSPEQALGEGHRVDGRTDIFSLGVVFYELLAGRLPFWSDQKDREEFKAELRELILTHDPRPPRQIKHAIPKELDRICLKALSKRAADRYSTAGDVAEELRAFVVQIAVGQYVGADAVSIPAGGPQVGVGLPTPTQAAASSTVTPGATSDTQPVPIVPKGLRSFDGDDAEFFLDLMPGPRDRGGIPSSIRFWKTRIEEMGADSTFSVGLIYGPSGCGKTSLVRAGLLPCLSANVVAVYCEASAKDTEAHLLRGLRRRCNGLNPEHDLTKSLSSIRQGKAVPAAKKVLIVIDQFEQWLHANRQAQKPELVRALRQCDGGRVQCIVMVRDDFWLASTRFMQQLEIRLVEGQNSALVDLFDLEHARRVLTKFGRAYGRFPPGDEEIAREGGGGEVTGRQTDKETRRRARAETNAQSAFVEQAVEELATEGKVVCVRLALFADMMKSKPWTPTTLREVGKAKGVGVTFLEESLSSKTAPPEHRHHQAAAEAVLKALLPHAGTDIKGHMRSEAELLRDSGYTNRRRDFDDLKRILDRELRLITPVNPEESGEGRMVSGENARRYQLTHDYLVPSLRAWLGRKQRETRRGRAELRLRELAAAWSAQSENRLLPPWWEWLYLRMLTRSRGWSSEEARMMKRARRYHALRGFGVAVCLVLSGLLGREIFGRMKAQTLRDRLFESTTAEAPGIVSAMTHYRRWVDPLLSEALAQEGENDSKTRLHASLALIPVDPRYVSYIQQRLLKCEPQDLSALRAALSDHKQEVVSDFWTVLQNKKNDEGMRFRAACALADYDPTNPRWNAVANDVAAALVLQNPAVISRWIEALRPAGDWLLKPLAHILEDPRRSEAERSVATSLFADYGKKGSAGILANRLAEEAIPKLTEGQKTIEAKRRANVGVALIQMGDFDGAKAVLSQSPDPTARSYLIHSLSPTRVAAREIIAHLEHKKLDASVCQALILSLGGYDEDHVSKGDREQCISMLLETYRRDPSPGVHGAAEWLLRSWGREGHLKEINEELQAQDRPVDSKGAKPGANRQWYLNSQGQSMMIIPPPGWFWMLDGAGRHKRALRHSYAIASKEVTVDEFKRFRQDHQNAQLFLSSGDSPANNLSWYEAAEYCNRLSEKEGIPPNEWCYEPNSDGKYAAGMKILPDTLLRSGYRLPTETEWEHACRAGSTTKFSFGDSEELARWYAWYAFNSNGKAHPVGTLKPNDFGLFDMHGNGWEWCQGVLQIVSDEENNHKPVEPLPDVVVVNDKVRRVLRGGYFSGSFVSLRSADYSWIPATGTEPIPGHPQRIPTTGFRVARTMRGMSPVDERR